MTLLTVQEVAEALKLSVLTIYKYIKENKLEAVSFGGHYRISPISLDNFIQNHIVSKHNSSDIQSEHGKTVISSESEKKAL